MEPVLVTPADRPVLADVLARAFVQNPFLCWTTPYARRRPASARRFFGERVRTLAPHELSWTTPDRAGAALWAPGDAWRTPFGETVRTLAAFASHRAALAALGVHRIERLHPGGPHLYLAVLGVAPGRQGEGLGSKLLAPGLAMCDREGVPAFLETDTEDNVRFYGRHGFRVDHEVALPRGGPPVWLMTRPSR